jgi:hypothetical protein
MLGADENGNKPIGKGGKRKSGQQGKKTERSRKAGQPKVTPDQLQAQDQLQPLDSTREAIAEASVTEASFTEKSVPDAPVTQEPVAEQIAQDPIDSEVSAPVVAAESSAQLPSSAGAPASAAANTASVSVQAVTNAYGDYSWKSLDQARTFFEQLAGVRSLDKAFQLQSDFAREAYDTFVAESRRIRELHGALAKQRLGHLEELVARMTRRPR